MDRAGFRPQSVAFGASWYPEMWPESEWAADVARMRELDFTLVRLFEFAWKRFEPRPGVYDFAWARRVLDLLHEAGIQAMVGTPTAAPPAWLTSTWPDTLGTGPDGRRKRHGTRKHYNQHSHRYRELSRGIVAAMVEAFADHPALHSWQIDNEMSGYDYGPETVRRFHAWLEAKFGTVEAMNRAWGLDFWSQTYDSFDQVPLATAEVGLIAVPERHHPSLILAIAEFQNQAWDTFVADQCAVIRAGSDKPISSNMVGFIGGMDWFRLNRNLDMCGASTYADLRFYHFNFMRFDRMRAEKPGTPYLLLETAPNWSGGGPIWNIHHDERGIRAYSWLTTALGGAGTIFWQWRSHWAGQEMQHGTHVSQTGRWMPGKAAWQALGREYREHGPWLMAHPPLRPQLAVMASSQARWGFAIDPIDPANKYEERFRDDYYLPLERAFWWRDIIHVSADLAHYRVILAPHLPILPRSTRAALAEWVHAGGHLLLGPLTGTRSEEFTSFTDREFGGLEEIMGVETATRFSPHWVEDTIRIDVPGGPDSQPRFWCEAFSLQTATALGHYRGGYGDGHVAIADHRVGEGSVVSLGCPVDTPLFLHLVGLLCGRAGIAPIASGDGEVVVVPRANADGTVVGHVVVNPTKDPHHVVLPKGGRDRLSGETVGGELALEPLQVRLIENL